MDELEKFELEQKRFEDKMNWYDWFDKEQKKLIKLAKIVIAIEIPIIIFGLIVLFWQILIITKSIPL